MLEVDAEALDELHVAGPGADDEDTDDDDTDEREDDDDDDVTATPLQVFVVGVRVFDNGLVVELRGKLPDASVADDEGKPRCFNFVVVGFASPLADDSPP